jgi:hypothetical protein
VTEIGKIDFVLGFPWVYVWKNPGVKSEVHSKIEVVYFCVARRPTNGGGESGTGESNKYLTV